MGVAANTTIPTDTGIKNTQHCKLVRNILLLYLRLFILQGSDDERTPTLPLLELCFMPILKLRNPLI
jgi:hypothetical protein